MLRGWSRNSTNKSKMADGRHLEKSSYVSAIVWPILTKFSTYMSILALWTFQLLRFAEFKNPRWPPAAILKKMEKSRYFGLCLTFRPENGGLGLGLNTEAISRPGPRQLSHGATMHLLACHILSHTFLSVSTEVILPAIFDWDFIINDMMSKCRVSACPGPAVDHIMT